MLDSFFKVISNEGKHYKTKNSNKIRIFSQHFDDVIFIEIK